VLHGGAEALLSATTDVWEIWESKTRARDIATLRERLGEEFELLYEEGLAMAQDEIIRLALTRTPSD
jgi:hypothetical protein